jgi:hypothetical protein
MPTAFSSCRSRAWAFATPSAIRGRGPCQTRGCRPSGPSRSHPGQSGRVGDGSGGVLAAAGGGPCVVAGLVLFQSPAGGLFLVVVMTTAGNGVASAGWQRCFTCPSRDSDGAPSRASSRSRILRRDVPRASCASAFGSPVPGDQVLRRHDPDLDLGTILQDRATWAGRPRFRGKQLVKSRARRFRGNVSPSGCRTDPQLRQRRPGTCGSARHGVPRSRHSRNRDGCGSGPRESRSSI